MSESIKLYNVIIEGRGLVGEVYDFKPSELKVKEEANDTSTADTPEQMDMGLEPMSCEFKVRDWGNAIRYFGTTGSPLKIRLEAAKENRGDWKSEQHTLEGFIRGVTPETLKRGAGMVATIKVSLTRNEVKIAGTQVLCVDTNPRSPCRIINGVDQLEKARELAQIG